MTPPRTIDALGVLAFQDVRALEPTVAQIRAARQAAGIAARRSGTRRRVGVVAVAATALAATTALAVPQTRDAARDAFGAFGDFLSGGDPPGAPVPSGERSGQLNWFTDAAPGTERVLAQTGDVRLAAFRQVGSGLACISYGRAVEECRSDEEWLSAFAASPVLLRGPLPEPVGTRLPLLGIVADAVTHVELLYADGSSDGSVDVLHGFVVLADPDRSPTTLVARDSAGRALATLDIADRQWRFSP